MLDAQKRRAAVTRVSFMSPQDPREEVAAALTPLLQDAE